MTKGVTADSSFPKDYLTATTNYILSLQRKDGAIPWFRKGHVDPWNHVEAAMGLSIGGQHIAAVKAYEWLQSKQNKDGGWWCVYRQGRATSNNYRASHFAAYIATGVWHHYLISGDKDFLHRLWPTVVKAMDFTLGLQTSQGDFYWAVDEVGSPFGDALVTGCSSIYKSLECAIQMATVVVEPSEHWQNARQRLAMALWHKPECFDRSGTSRQRFAMDWFYPVLTGVIRGEAAKERLNKWWERFVVEGLGCRCVIDEPWITVAESCELVIALMAAGESERAVELYAWLDQWRDAQGFYWTGYQFQRRKLWPREAPTWTAAAVLLAADAISKGTGAADLFVQVAKE